MANFKFFIKRGSLFVLGFLLFVFILQNAVFLAVKSINVGEFGVLNQINKGIINTDIIISGSSRALKAINPQVITEQTGLTCYNISSDGSDLGIQIPKLKWYLNKNEKPKYIIQDLYQFGGDVSSTIYEPYKYLPYLKDDSLFTGISKVNTKFSMHKYLYPTNLVYFNFDFYVKLIQELLHSVKHEDFLVRGFYPDDSKWSGNPELFDEEHPDGVTSTFTEEFQSSVKELIRLCRNNDIVLILTVLPNHLSPDQINQDGVKVIDYYRSFEEDGAVYLFDYSKDPVAGEQTYFYNYTHLNESGANVLSMELGADLADLISKNDRTAISYQVGNDQIEADD